MQATVWESTKSRRPLVGRAAALVSVIAAVLAIGPATVHASPVTIAKSGEYGYWVGDEWPSTNACSRLSITWISPAVSRTRYHLSSTESVYLRTQVQYWNGSAWTTYYTSPWERRDMPPGIYTTFFAGKYLPVPQRRYYRVRQDYEWYLVNNGGRYLGRVTNLFDESSYHSYNANFVGHTGTGPSYCYIA